MQKHKFTFVIISLALATFACTLLSRPTSTIVVVPKVDPTSIPTRTGEPETSEPTETPIEISVSKPEIDEPVRLTGTIEVSNALIVAVYYYERFAMLEDLTGYVQRDYEYIQPLNAQIIGPISVNEEGEFTYTIHLPAQPTSPTNDVDNDGEDDVGVQIWQIAMNSNYMDDPFLGDDESGGWSASYTSARIDSENKNEVYGGSLLIWSPDGNQDFPIGFGVDGLLFTEDDPLDTVPPGYSVANLDTEPFTFSKEIIVDITLFEGELTVNDYSEMGWSEAFSALHEKISREYPFTEMKNMDWDALYIQFAPKMKAAETENDETEYFLALRDYAWSIPDGHVGMSYGEIGNELFNLDTEGGYGLAIIGLDDERVIASIVTEGGPASEAGLRWGAEILEWDGQPIQEALDQVVPWSMPFSTSEARRVQQYRYLLRSQVGNLVEVVFQNPGESTPQSVSLIAIAETETFSATSVYSGYDFNALPLEYEILPSDYGYIKINSLSEDINLIIRLWEWALERMINMNVPGIIIDMRQNSGGSPLGTLFASYFIEDRLDISRSYYYSEKSGGFETYGPPSYTEPDDDLYYDGQLGVLVGPACASACEDVAYVLSQLEQTRVFGFYASSGMFGEVARGQYLLPGGYSFQAPTGMDRDMDGNTIIEGSGVIPDVHVPINEDTVRAQYKNGEDVVFNFAIETINQPLGAGIVPEANPKMGNTTDAETAFQAETPWLEDLVLETYDEDSLSQAGTVYTYTVPLNTSKDVMWVYAWCTADETHFDDNWSKIHLDFAINEEPIALEGFAILEGVFSGNHCRVYYTVLRDWAIGEHVLTTSVTFSGPINDGLVEEDFPSGTHVYEYHVIVGR